MTTTQRRAPARVRRPWVVGAVVFALLISLLVTVRATSGARLQAWKAACAADRGTVRVLRGTDVNPLITESRDPTYECWDPTGQLLDRWR